MRLQKHQFAVVNIRCTHEHRWQKTTAITRLLQLDPTSFRRHTASRRSCRYMVVDAVAAAGCTVGSSFRYAHSWLRCRYLLLRLILGDERCNQIRTFEILCRLLGVQSLNDELQTMTNRFYPCIFTVRKALPFEQIFNERDHPRLSQKAKVNRLTLNFALLRGAHLDDFFNSVLLFIEIRIGIGL